MLLFVGSVLLILLFIALFTQHYVLRFSLRVCATVASDS